MSEIRIELADVLSAWIESAPVEIRTTDAALVGRGTFRGLDSLIANRTKQIETIRSTKSQRDLVATITLPGGDTSSDLINPGMATGEIKGILRNSISESRFTWFLEAKRSKFQMLAGEKDLVPPSRSDLRRNAASAMAVGILS